MTDQTDNKLDLTADIVSAYLANNTVAADQVPGLIASIYNSLNTAGQPVEEPTEELEKPSAAQIRRSISDDGLISFLDGKTYKSLKRHLSTNGFTPEAYRERYGLRNDYPMVSPAYSRARSELAKTMGLGSKGRQPAKDAAAKPARKPRAPKADAKA